MIGVAPFTHGMEITSAELLSNSSLIVRFTSAYDDAYLYQLYVGRTLVGVSNGVLDRNVIGIFFPSEYPETIQLLAVDPSDRTTDFGDDLPDRPYNRVKITYNTASMTIDTEWIEVSSGTEPEGAVNVANVIASDFYRGTGTFGIITDPLGPGGEWNFEIAGRDGTAPDGNRGTALELSATIKAHPPDVIADENGDRFSVAANAGTLTIGFALAF